MARIPALAASREQKRRERNNTARSRAEKDGNSKAKIENVKYFYTIHAGYG